MGYNSHDYRWHCWLENRVFFKSIFIFFCCSIRSWRYDISLDRKEFISSRLVCYPIMFYLYQQIVSTLVSYNNEHTNSTVNVTNPW
jgi:hypothetical protein